MLRCRAFNRRWSVNNYGGGKTHTLITLFHLVNDPASLPDLPAVHEFKARIDVPLPATRVAVLPFDKFDVEKGIEVRDPAGNVRMLRQPWSALAWQLAGADGLRLLHPDDQPEERRTAPAENLLHSVPCEALRGGLRRVRSE